MSSIDILVIIIFYKYFLVTAHTSSSQGTEILILKNQQYNLGYKIEDPCVIIQVVQNQKSKIKE